MTVELCLDDKDKLERIKNMLLGKGFAYGGRVNEVLGEELFCDFDMLSVQDGVVMINYDR